MLKVLLVLINSYAATNAIIDMQFIKYDLWSH